MNHHQQPIIDLDQAYHLGLTLGEAVYHAAVLRSVTKISANGIVVTPLAFSQFLTHQNLGNIIKATLLNTSTTDPHQIALVSQDLQKRLCHHPFPQDLVKQLRRQLKRNLSTHFFRLLPSYYHKHLKFPSTSVTVLTGTSVLFDQLRRSWAQVLSPQNIHYLKQDPHSLFQVPAYIVQEFPLPEYSGRVYSRHSSHKNHALIHASLGIAPFFGLTAKDYLPQIYQVDTVHGHIIRSQLIRQAEYITLDRFAHPVIRKDRHLQTRAFLSDTDLLSLARLSRIIQNHFLSSQEIHWVSQSGRLILLQTSRLDHPLDINLSSQKAPDPAKLLSNLKMIASGLGASPGIVSAPARVVTNSRSLKTFGSGEIIVAPHASYDLLIAIKKAVGIITDAGGSMSHAAIIARELGIPAVVGTKHATKHCRTGQIITLDGSQGFIYQGGLPNYHTPIMSKPAKPTPSGLDLPQQTATKIMVNLSTQNAADRWAHLAPHGIGALRGDLLLVEYGLHPKTIKQSGKQSSFISFLALHLHALAQQCPHHPILYHAADLTTAQYSVLKNGPRFEPIEPNPLIGLRGAARIAQDPWLFECEIAALKQVRHQHQHRQVHLVFPSVHTPPELKQLKLLAASMGLVRSSSFHLYAPLTVPANVFDLPAFSRLGIDGILININSLTSLAFGLDPTNPELQHLDLSGSHGLTSLVKHALFEAKSAGLKSIAYGHGLTKQPDLINSLVKWGIWGITVDPLAFHQVKHEVAYAESRLIRTQAGEDS